MTNYTVYPSASLYLPEVLTLEWPPSAQAYCSLSPYAKTYGCYAWICVPAPLNDAIHFAAGRTGSETVSDVQRLENGRARVCDALRLGWLSLAGLTLCADASPAALMAAVRAALGVEP